MEINPLSIILVKSDSKGDRLLFRYPYVAKHTRDSNQCTKRKNPYTLTTAEDLLQVSFMLNYHIKFIQYTVKLLTWNINLFCPIHIF